MIFKKLIVSQIMKKLSHLLLNPEVAQEPMSGR